MKWILVFFATWNAAGALLRAFRMALEKMPLTRGLYPRREMRPLDEVSDLELGPRSKERYRAAVQELSVMSGMPAPELLYSPKHGMLAGARGWTRSQLQVSRGTLAHADDDELLAILAHEFGHIYYRHFAAVRIAELFAAAAYASAVYRLWGASMHWYIYLAIWSLLDFSYSLFRLAVGSATELMADHFAARRLGMASELSSGLTRAQCVNGATEFVQITHFYPTVKLRLRMLARYVRALDVEG